MRFLPKTLLVAAAVTLSGCAGMPDKDQLWSRSSAFFSQSSEMIAAQTRRLADFAGGLVGSNDQALLQEEVDKLFAQPYIDPLTAYLEEHSADDRRARQLAQVADEREQRCAAIAAIYVKRDATQANLQRMRRGYTLSCPEQVQQFATRVTLSAATSTAASTAASASSQADRAMTAQSDTALADALTRRQNGNCYLLFTIKNYTQAQEACQPVAEGGDAKAQHHMANLARARGDHANAFTWAQRSADQGHAPGLLTLGQLNQAGEGVPQNPAKGLRLIRQAADQGLTEASYHAGLAYQNGLGTEASTELAESYLKQAAAQGHMPAHLALAAMNEQRNPEAQRYWLSEAARKGSAEAQRRLADSYADNAASATDHEAAYVWYSLAVLNGNAQAKAGIEQQEKHLTADQLTSARQRIQDGINGKWN